MITMRRLKCFFSYTQYLLILQRKHVHIYAYNYTFVYRQQLYNYLHHLFSRILSAKWSQLYIGRITTSCCQSLSAALLEMSLHIYRFSALRAHCTAVNSIVVLIKSIHRVGDGPLSLVLSTGPCTKASPSSTLFQRCAQRTSMQGIFDSCCQHHIFKVSIIFRTYVQIGQSYQQGLLKHEVLHHVQINTHIYKLIKKHSISCVFLLIK